MPNAIIKPSWSEWEADLHSEDSEKARAAAEAFDETRKLELRTSAKARKREADRKAEWARNKPAWVKQQTDKEQAFLSHLTHELKQGGTFDSPIQPMPGFLITVPDPLPETTDSGLYLAAGTKLPQNTGRVLAIGDKLVHLKEVVYPPVKPGERILYKRGAGLDLTIQGENVLLQQWSDILGRIEE